MELLRDAREGAGLSQRELAQRAGTSQAMVARIERGQQSPSVATLERLVRACGRELLVEASGGERGEAGTAPKDTRLLVWRTGATAYAFPIEAVERIVELDVLHRLPGQAPAAGVVIVDGTAVAAVDAAVRLGADDAAPAHVVVVGVDNGRRAVVVDHAETLAAETAVAPPPPGSGAAAFVTGLAEIEAEPVVVLDPNGFCAV
jgi:transcriptional regulator with XRE-family HTH domain